MRLIMGLVGYLAVSALIAQAMLFAYLWKSDRLNDEKMFQIVALVHDINLDETPTSGEEAIETEIPREEPSLAEIERTREIALRNFEVKLTALDTGKREYDHMLRQLNASSDRYDRLSTEFQERLALESEQLEQQNIANVVRDLQVMKADKAKELLLLTLDQGGPDPESKLASMDEVINLMSHMQNDKLEAILKKFAGPDEMRKLHELHQRMLEGGDKQEALEDVKRQIEDRDYSL